MAPRPCTWSLVATLLIVTHTSVSMSEIVPVLPAMRTCAAGSPAEKLQFCDETKTYEERAELLVAELNTTELIVLWALHSYHYPIPRLNIKGVHRDTCCVHGPALNYMDRAWVGVEPKYVTVLPHAINHGAMFDVEFAAKLANMTGNEMRAASQIRYRTSGGQAFAAVICDSGPLANTAHHPAWGRISECYAEDPYLVAQTGVAVTQAMQASDRGTLKTALTTRHFIGYHATNTMPDPAMTVTDRDLYDAYLPGYQALQDEGEADGIMCSFGSFDGVPSCANKRLLTDVLRGEWGSPAVVQSDCCDSVTSIKSLHNYTTTFEQAVAAAFDAGLQLCFGCDPHLGHGPSKNASMYLANALVQGLVSQSQLKSAIARVMLTRFKLGEFDESEGRPYGHVDESVLDSSEHRALAREAAAASIVLAHNRCDGGGCTLPFDLNTLQSQQNATVAVIGPFSNCSDEVGGGWAKTNCYLHSYAGIPSKIVSILDAVVEEAAATQHGVNVVYKEGTTDVNTISDKGIADAAAAAKHARLTVLAVGLGSNVEKEGLDRSTLTLPHVQQLLLQAVASAVKEGGGRLVVVVVAAGPVPIDAATANIDALLYAGYGGEEAGHGVTDVMFGRYVPSARFPLTVYAEDYLSKVGPVSDYSTTSGVGRTYRYLDVSNSAPQYMFGYGLSYTTFEYSNLTTTTTSSGVSNDDGDNGVADAHVSNTDHPNVHVAVTVRNTGTYDAHEVVQLYVAVPGAGATAPQLPIPIISLQGFNRTYIEAGDSALFQFVVSPSQYTTVTANGSRVISVGVYHIHVGGSQPGDPSAPSNVLNGTFVISAPKQQR